MMFRFNTILIKTFRKSGDFLYTLVEDAQLRWKSSTSVLFALQIFLLFFSFISYSQIDNKNLEFVANFDSTKIKKVQFRLNSFNYLKNNEFFNQIVDGYTLFGVYVNPKIAYQINEKILIEGGIFIDKQFGRKGLQEVEPTFSIKYQPNNWRLIFGNLEGNITHRMIEPLMNFERIIKHPQELGIQAKYQKNAIFFDTWLDWQKATLAGEKQQEHIMFGASVQGSKFRIQNSEFQPLIQLTVFHQGGQNIMSELPVKTFFNSALGGAINYKKFSFEPYYVSNFEGKNKGTAAYINCRLKTEDWQLILSYWNGNNYNSPIGGDLFQSFSRKFNNENHTEKNRNLLIFRIIRDWKLANELNISFRFEPHYDFKNQIFEHNEGLYLRLKL